jgi:hypothetical protein
MRVSVAMTYFGENNINNLVDISQAMTREQSVTPSIRILFYFIYSGITWWAPIPDTKYKSQYGRDLNLEDICSKMVSYNPVI